jgi:hypothetical protein
MAKTKKKLTRKELGTETAQKFDRELDEFINYLV